MSDNRNWSCLFSGRNYNTQITEYAERKTYHEKLFKIVTTAQICQSQSSETKLGHELYGVLSTYSGSHQELQEQKELDPWSGINTTPDHAPGPQTIIPHPSDHSTDGCNWLAASRLTKTLPDDEWQAVKSADGRKAMTKNNNDTHKHRHALTWIATVGWLLYQSGVLSFCRTSSLLVCFVLFQWDGWDAFRDAAKHHRKAWLILLTLRLG